ncbi:MAG: hypothetical protein HYW48_10880 [Deltaproteobacteria bacterium]|nr:hypothetical protein [Deltaproteobacteria bacterium]
MTIVLKTINWGTNFYKSVIPRLDRGIQLIRGRLPLDPAVKPRDDRGGEL